MKQALLLLTLLPSLALAQGISRDVKPGEFLMMTRHLAVAITATTYQGTTTSSERSVKVSAVTMRLATPASGAGTVTFRISDGTRNCDCAISCTATGVAGLGDAGSKRAACSGACAFPPSSLLTFSCASAGCATSQGVPTSLDVWGSWL